MPGEALAHFSHELRFFDRFGSDNNPLHTGFEIGFDGFRRTDTAANLYWQIRVLACNGFNDFSVNRLASKRTVQIHKVQATGTGFHPASGHINRVATENGGVFHTALAQAYASAIFQINGGDNQHVPFQSVKFLRSCSPALALFSG